MWRRKGLREEKTGLEKKEEKEDVERRRKQTTSPPPEMGIKIGMGAYLCNPSTQETGT